jgi:hypothetical protein
VTARPRLAAAAPALAALALAAGCGGGSGPAQDTRTPPAPTTTAALPGQALLDQLAGPPRIWNEPDLRDAITAALDPMGRRQLLQIAPPLLEQVASMEGNRRLPRGATARTREFLRARYAVLRAALAGEGP